MTLAALAVGMWWLFDRSRAGLIVSSVFTLVSMAVTHLLVTLSLIKLVWVCLFLIVTLPLIWVCWYQRLWLLVDGVQRANKHSTSGGQIHNQEAAADGAFYIEKSSLFFLLIFQH